MKASWHSGDGICWTITVGYWPTATKVIGATAAISSYCIGITTQTGWALATLLVASAPAHGCWIFYPFEWAWRFKKVENILTNQININLNNLLRHNNYNPLLGLREHQQLVPSEVHNWLFVLDHQMFGRPWIEMFGPKTRYLYQIMSEPSWVL